MAQGETPDGASLDMPPQTKKPEVTEITLQEAKWLLEYYDIDQDDKLNLEEFAAIFMEKSSKFKKAYKLIWLKQNYEYLDKNVYVFWIVARFLVKLFSLLRLVYFF